jgi:hypothetical protein
MDNILSFFFIITMILAAALASAAFIIGYLYHMLRKQMARCIQEQYQAWR